MNMSLSICLSCFLVFNPPHILMKFAFGSRPTAGESVLDQNTFLIISCINRHGPLGFCDQSLTLQCVWDGNRQKEMGERETDVIYFFLVYDQSLGRWSTFQLKRWQLEESEEKEGKREIGRWSPQTKRVCAQSINAMVLSIEYSLYERPK